MKRNRILAAVTLLSIALLIVGCATQTNYPVKIKLLTTKTYDIHTDLQTSYLKDKDVANIKTYADGSTDLSSPKPVVLEWSASGENEPDSYKVRVYEGAEKAVLEREIDTIGNDIEVYNLKVGTTYAWTVEAYDDGELVGYADGTFKTVDTLPRNLYIDGVTNCRDVGGWKTQDGGRVRQGLLYRTAKLNKNGLLKINPLITSDGISMMKDVLKVKTELDLRRDLNNEVGGIVDVGTLGEDVNYVCAAMMDTFPIIQKLSYAGIAEAFEVLADEGNYPIFFHCSIGTDRTGAIAFFVLNLCGVAEKDIYRDYLFSNFGKIGSNRTYRQCQVYFDTIEPFEGRNWTEKTRSFLLSIGVTDEQMDSVVRIMKEN